MSKLVTRLFFGIAVIALDFYIISGWMWVAEHKAYSNVSSMPAMLLTIGALVISIWYLRWLLKAAYPPLTREDCPHFNVDGDQKCNLLPEPSECNEYCRKANATVYKRD
jgi:hypothetical protein